ncbi:MAG: hypothetical protein HY053_01385 [Proteobacteria bacterium]|nr:hypothetical protein [Pseudomonadota bacterium]
MNKIYRISGLRTAGSASIVARAISALHKNLSVTVDVEEGVVNVQGSIISDFQIASAVRSVGCAYLGPIKGERPH